MRFLFQPSEESDGVDAVIALHIDKRALPIGAAILAETTRPFLKGD